MAGLPKSREETETGFSWRRLKEDPVFLLEEAEMYRWTPLKVYGVRNERRKEKGRWIAHFPC
jgi:hypothetical protein